MKQYGNGDVISNLMQQVTEVLQRNGRGYLIPSFVTNIQGYMEEVRGMVGGGVAQYCDAKMLRELQTQIDGVAKDARSLVTNELGLKGLGQQFYRAFSGWLNQRAPAPKKVVCTVEGDDKTKTLKKPYYMPETAYDPEQDRSRIKPTSPQILTP